MSGKNIWGQDLYDYIKMCDHMGKKFSKNSVLGVNGPIGIGKKYLIKMVCKEVERKFICIKYTKLVEFGCLLIEKYIHEEDNKPLLFYIEETLKNDANYPTELDLLVECIRNHKKIKNCIFIFSSTAIMGSNSNIEISFRVFRYGCLSFDEKKELAHEIVTQCQQQMNLENVSLSDRLIQILIKNYTKEAGINYLSTLIRNLYEEIYYKKNYIQENSEITEITNKTIFNILGSGCYVNDEKIIKKYDQGIGLAWTRWGGELLLIQIESSRGKGKIVYSGNVGNLMKESIEVVFQYLKINYKAWNIQKRDIYRNDFYISISELGLYKDGASAGLAFLVKLICKLKKIKFIKPVAFSGEVTLDCRILRVGGLKEKINVAQMHGIQKIVLPRQSLPEYLTLPKLMRNRLNVYFIDKVNELVKIFLKEQSD